MSLAQLLAHIHQTKCAALQRQPSKDPMNLTELLAEIKRLEDSGAILPGKMPDGSPSIAATISWVFGEMALSRHTPPEGMAMLEEQVRATVYAKFEKELCSLRAERSVVKYEHPIIYRGSISDLATDIAGISNKDFSLPKLIEALAEKLPHVPK